MQGVQDLLQRFWAGEPRALARLISILENEEPGRDELMRQLFSKTGRAYLLGVTGSPGTGKSSLVDRLTALLRQRGQKVGIVAVDPTSPFSGGALLGDRIRMQEHAVDQGVFIRSMGTRGSLGGLARTTREAVKAMDAFGFDWVIVETVGVGQAELDIMHVADSVIVVLTPGAGDSIQTIKAGIMEIADIFAVNKSDLPGADKVALEVEMMLDLHSPQMSWRPPVVKTSTVTGTGLEDLLAAIERHRTYLLEKGLFQQRREERLRSETLEILDRQWQQLVRKEMKLSEEVNDLLDAVARRQTDPYTAASSILNYVVANSGPRQKNQAGPGG
ncbi:MAG: methylmalonyl Co-A mutase-associated GTPase MeaB [Armatimonadetes bacterium]|nr:methylmalonyl Co-A mutase-associated GTPase MeaB [Armatimonadota bacterium]